MSVWASGRPTTRTRNRHGTLRDNRMAPSISSSCRAATRCLVPGESSLHSLYVSDLATEIDLAEYRKGNEVFNTSERS